MTLRMPDYRNPEAVLMIMTREEYLRYKEKEEELQGEMKVLEVEATFEGMKEDQVTLTLAPAPRDFFGNVFVSLIAGRRRFITMRAEDFAQDLEDIGFTVEFS